jgi:uncharacterized SAM-binding protein YcdF (DUF218 family)
VFFVLSKSLDLAVAPLTWVLGLIAAALFLLLRKKQRRRAALICLGVACLVILICGNRMVANRAWWWLEASASSTYREDVTYDAVILLGGLLSTGTQDPTRLPTYNDNVERLLVTYDLLRRDRVKTVIIAGGAPAAVTGSLLEADALAAQLVAWGIAPDRIVIENRSINTRQNAVEAVALVRGGGFEKVLLITSAFHMKRAAGCFRAVDLEPDTLPVDHRAREPSSMSWEVSPRSDAFDRTSDALREVVGRVVYSLLGYAR